MPVEIKRARYSPTAGPCLKPWPEPPPAIHRLSWSGWRSITKSPLAVFSVLAHTAFDDRSISESRQPACEPVASPRDAFWIYGPLPRVRVEARSMGIDPDLDAAVLETGNRIQPGGEVDDRRRPTCAEPIVAGWGAEVQHDLSCRRDARTEQVGEHRGQPRAARKHETFAAELSSIGQADRRHAPRRHWLQRSTRSDGDPPARELGRERLHRASSHDHATLRFEHQ